MQEIITLAQKISIPVIHTCLRSELGKAFTGKWGPRATMISIINYEGYQDMMEVMMTEWDAARMKYNLI